MTNNLTDINSFWNIGWVHPKHSERQVERTSVWKENVEGRFLSCVPRARGGSSGYFMIADCEDLQESKASDICVKRFKSQDLFGREEYRFPCSNGISRFSDRARPSSIAEGRFEQQHDVETEEGDKKGSNKEDSWSMSGEFFRHHEEFRLKLYDPDNETFSIPIRQCNETTSGPA